MSQWLLALVVSLSACVLSIPPWRSLIEQSMLWHMAVQMPLMVAGGLLLARAATSRVGIVTKTDHWAAWNRYGLTGFIASQFVLTYWMLPLAIDRAVVVPQVDALKVMSLLICGALLADAFKRSPAALQLFFVGYTLSMVVSTGVYLATSERRLCNAYALDSQVDAGRGVAAVGLLLAAIWGVSLLRSSHRK